MREQRASRVLWHSLVLALLVTSFTPGVAQSQRIRPRLMSDPIATIIEAFQTHPIVAVGEGPHGNLQGHAFRLALIRDARFAASVQNVVVESGNALYQALMDRFTSGEDVPSSLLRAVWQDTTQNSPVWDRPIYEELFREIRARNRDLPEERRLRVLLGDPPVDWTKVLAGVRSWARSSAVATATLPPSSHAKCSHGVSALSLSTATHTSPARQAASR